MRNVGRAHTVTVGDGGKSLDVAAEQPGEDLCLGLAQLGEFLGNMSDRAVVLAHLGAAGGVARRGREAIGRERLGEHAGALLRFGGFDEGAVTLFELAHAMTSECHDRLVSTGALQVAEGIGSEPVVGLLEVIAAGVGDDEDLCWTATTPRAADALLAGFEDTVCKKLIKVATHRGGREPEPLGKVDRRGRPLLENRVGDAFTGRCIVDRRRMLDPIVFHNTIVPLIEQAFNEGMP